MALTYRKELPDVPGLWWVLDGAGVEQVVEIVEHRDRGVYARSSESRLVAYQHGVDGFEELRDLRAVGWAGPLARPVLP